jgi:hypothetical protein
MLLGLPQSAATLLTILLFYLLDFSLIRRFDRQRQASGSGRSWDFTFFIFVMVAVLVLQPLLFPRLSFRTTQSWGLLIQVVGYQPYPCFTLPCICGRASICSSFTPSASKSSRSIK